MSGVNRIEKRGKPMPAVIVTEMLRSPTANSFIWITKQDRVPQLINRYQDVPAPTMYELQRVHFSKSIKIGSNRSIARVLLSMAAELRAEQASSDNLNSVICSVKCLFFHSCTPSSGECQT